MQSGLFCIAGRNRDAMLNHIAIMETEYGDCEPFELFFPVDWLAGYNL